jgi:nucleotide-binding universal stress UspA family protein
MTVVCGTTLSDGCQASVEVAALLAARLGARLRLVHVSEDLRAPVVLGTSEERAVLGAVRDALEAEGRRVATLSGAHVDVHLAAGPVADALVAVADFEAARYLVLGPGNDARPPHVSAVVERVARRATTPTLVVKAPATLRRWLAGSETLSVLVGADLGRSARAARDIAASLREAGPVAAVTVSVVGPEVVGVVDIVGVVDVDDLRARLARGGPQGEAVEVVSADTGPEVRLASLASERGAGVVVVGQRARALLDRIWSGSVSRGVLDAVATNVLCVPAALAPIAVAGRAPDVVVVAVDVDDIEIAQRALAQAVAVARPGGVVHLITVVGDVGDDRGGAPERAWSALSRLVQRHGDEVDNGSPIVSSIERHVLEGEVVPTVLAFAERKDAAMIVVGGRRRSVVARAFMGSVTRELVDAAQVPVLVVPPERS